ncbi:hypothetical protein M5689_023674 [Euphorbia peplus]|nr:hypothetical protein M5689_023674 [Euphorbia peplus]
MGDKAPHTIFTDQDQAMANAISVVFPETRHRLCIWHISQNAPSHLGNLNSDKEFQRLFYKVLHTCESEKEFDEAWSKLCDTFEEVKGHKWLEKLYNIRQKWCKGLNKDVFFWWDIIISEE